MIVLDRNTTLHMLALLLCLCAFKSKKLREHEASMSASANASAHAKKRRPIKRVPWSHVDSMLNERQFRRMFRMTRECFHLLCDKIKISVGENTFKSQIYIDTFLDHPGTIHYANCRTTGGFISGETKLAITIRLLSGGDCMDLGVIFDISSNHCRVIMYEVLEHWINGSKIGGIDIQSYLNDEAALAKVSAGFSQRSDGVLKGAIGAIDGWLVRIQKPSFRMDRIKNSLSFYSRKGFFALNVQCIVDHNKKVLWASYRHKGASHDSSAFRDTKLYTLLKKKAAWLYQRGYFLLGDSAYAIESFIIPPYDLTRPKTPNDDFNFFHSSARITVECAFGEIDLRWGIFWRRLNFALPHTFIIIEGAMRIHNFLVDFRNDNIEEIRSELTISCTQYYSSSTTTDEIPGVIVNDSRRLRGRVAFEERMRRIQGLEIRDRLRQDIVNHNMHRPALDNDWYYNNLNHIVRQ